MSVKVSRAGRAEAGTVDPELEEQVREVTRVVLAEADATTREGSPPDGTGGGRDGRNERAHQQLAGQLLESYL